MEEADYAPSVEDLVFHRSDSGSDCSEAADSIAWLESPIDDEIGAGGYGGQLPRDSNAESDDGNEPSSSVPKELEQQDGEGRSCFTLDFYRCGTDWSSLLQDDGRKRSNRSTDSSGRLRQTSLLQLWGLKGEKTPISQNSWDMPHNKKAKSIHPSSVACNSSKRGRSKSAATTETTATAFFSVSHRAVDADTSNGGAHNIQQSPRQCPFYKKISGTAFTVDAFRYGRIKGCSAYFLSHFHADHYGGLNKSWSHGPIYCTHLTARLIRMCLSVQSSVIHPLELGVEYLIGQVKVTMLDANHCPGAALIFFDLPDGKCYLHTGDFRASKQMQDYPLLKQKIRSLYLDTTYCNPKYRFPSKEDVLNFVVKTTSISLKRHSKTLIIVGAYSIGKESVFIAISKALGVKIYANASRRRILKAFGWPEISDNLCTDGKESPLHVLPISSIKFQVLESYLKTFADKYTAVLAFRPTGWTYNEAIGSHLDSMKPSQRGMVTIYGVPYSEHSSFTELREFVQSLRPEKIIPTVNVASATNRDKMQNYFQEWLKG